MLVLLVVFQFNFPCESLRAFPYVTRSRAGELLGPRVMGLSVALQIGCAAEALLAIHVLTEKSATKLLVDLDFRGIRDDIKT